jgi:hypothetical protein
VQVAESDSIAYHGAASLLPNPLRSTYLVARRRAGSDTFKVYPGALFALQPVLKKGRKGQVSHSRSYVTMAVLGRVTPCEAKQGAGQR